MGGRRFWSRSSCAGSLALGIVLGVSLGVGLTPDQAFGNSAEFPIAGKHLLIRAPDAQLQIRGAEVVPTPPLAARLEKLAKSNRLRFHVRNQSEIGPHHDPAAGGMTLLIAGTGPNGGHSGLIELDPALWSPIGKAGAPKGYRYKDKAGTRGGITQVLLRDGRLDVRAKGPNLPWFPSGSQDSIWVIVTMGEEQFCVEFGGRISKNEAGRFTARDAVAPAACPAALCGNGEIELAEECDDGNLNEVDGCTSACAIGSCELAQGIGSTFDAIQRVVFDSEVYGCANGVCHGGAGRGNLSLLDGESYDELVGVPAFGSTLKRVEPGEPDQSYLYQLLAAATLGTPIPGGGTPMPTGGPASLTQNHLEGVKAWIRGGAPRDLVVEGTPELLGSCLPDPDPLTIPVPPPPGAGRGVQFQQTPWPLPAQFEDEICMATYYDLTATELVPDFAKVACPPEFLNINNPSGECFAYHKQTLFQDPQSHHAIIHIYAGQFDHTNPGWGPFTRKFQDPTDPLEGTPCDPTDVDASTGYNSNCSGGVISSIACIGYGPPDYSLGFDFVGFEGGTAPAFSASQEPFYEQELAPGAYSILPMQGFIVWNSHAFNLTTGDSTMSLYLNLELAGPGDQLFPARVIFDATSIFVQNVPPFQSREYCRTYTVPENGRLFQLSSHTHRHGKLWRIWAPPNTPCVPGQPSCVPDTSRAPIYKSTEYSDPVQLNLDPPVVHDDPDVRSRTYLYCSVYDNGEEVNSSGEPLYPVKRQSTSPEPPLVFGLPLGPGGPCPDSQVVCLDGPKKGQLCGGDDSFCDSAAGGDGACDACPLRGGVTTEDEMFIQLGGFYVDDGSTAGTEITPQNVSSLGVQWDFPLGAGVTSSPTVTTDFVYATSWDGKVYALNKNTGAEEWSFDTGSAVILGVQSTITVAPGGQVVFGDSLANVYFLNGQTGELIWQTSIGNPAVDHVWGAATIADGRIFIGVASHSDQPCTNGRLVALDLASGDVLWTRQNVPQNVCSTDTSIECTSDSQCGAGSCVRAVGAGVTAKPTVDPSGSFVYSNTVGCFTFPSVGDSDSIMKLDAATGDTLWIRRVDPPEQFGFCSNDPSIECGTDAQCGVGTCTTKPAYHDFGFLNGPLLLDVDDGLGGTKTIVVSGSKNGTLYALNEADGTIAWTNAVLPKPVSPAFAGFGLFNGALGYENGRIHAALYQFLPPATPAPDHLMTFDATDGSTLWSDDIGPSWGHVAASNGVVFSGTNNAPEFYAYDAATGARLATFPLPVATSSMPSIDGRSLYIGYGIFGNKGGVRAYILP